MELDIRRQFLLGQFDFLLGLLGHFHRVGIGLLGNHQDPAVAPVDGLFQRDVLDRIADGGHIVQVDGPVVHRP